MSPDATPSRKPFGIGHVAKVTGVAVATLRSWEAQGLLTPHKSSGGHRSFTPEDIDRVRRIEHLRRFSGQRLSGIRRLLDEQVEPERPPRSTSSSTVETVDFGKIGARVRSLREGAGLSLRDVSSRTEIGVSHLSMFERGTAFLSPARLNALAELFGRSLGELLGGTRRRDVPVVRRGAGRMVGTFGPGVSIEQLTVAQHLMDAEVWTIEPGRESDGFYAHEGEEFLLVLDGEIEITLADRDPEVIGEGDSAYFSSRIQHRWRNISGAPARILWVNTDHDRLGAMRFERLGREIGLGPAHGTGMGEDALAVALPDGSQTYRVIETHTAGHPTRILIEPLAGLDGATVAEKADTFAARYDHLRPLLLHEPRGHSGSLGLVPVPSARADFGAFFVASYGYPKLCGHAVIGFAKALSALGRLKGRRTFSVEMPGGIVEVSLVGTPSKEAVSVTLPSSFVLVPALSLTVGGRPVEAAVVFGGNTHVLVDAATLDLDLTPERLGDLLALGAAIREAADVVLGPQNIRSDSVLFYQAAPEAPDRLLLVIDRHKYDRSPGVTGLAARMTQLFHLGRLGLGETHVATSLFGGQLSGEILARAGSGERADACVPRVTGRAHLNSISTLILEPDDALGRGFLQT